MPSQSASTSISIAFSRNRSTSVGPWTPANAVAHLVGVVADAHRAAAEHVRRAHEHRVADPVGDVDRLRAALGDPPLRAADAELGEQLAEPLAILGEVDGVERRAEDAEPAASIARASLSGVWPPNWITTPSGCSRSQIASTDAVSSGSK